MGSFRIGDPMDVRLVATVVSRDIVDLFWAPPRGNPALSFEIEWKRGSGSSWSELVLPESGKRYSLRHSGLRPENKYVYRIRAHFGDGETGKWSVAVAATTEKDGLGSRWRSAVRFFGMGDGVG